MKAFPPVAPFCLPTRRSGLNLRKCCTPRLEMRDNAEMPANLAVVYWDTWPRRRRHAERDRRLWADWGLRNSGVSFAGWFDRLALFAALRFARMLRGAAGLS